MNKKIESFRDIIAWQKAHRLVVNIYEITEKFPDSEKFGLVSQMRRASVSVASNIVEGFARKNIKESLNFYNFAHASLEELKYQILISNDIKLINNKVNSVLVELSEEAGKTLHGWIRSQLANSGCTSFSR
ncbi:four helix bundle protein [Candidatus Falkowbacteria bacterium RIFOXYD2_FULL_35_9]|uniref:Four helix bundle protein n=1 Tax=Candidatus Falkowbacteria bacterium RIFOXYC2_FULL_36_12 TaxID=1798002 RepID=A0A1F5SYA5_9BACT|nr:MAG: four helix bundle protein [Candidatus Falkowbacteria bacterium RIFOXYC2_FULL_36_12]OGF31992.1 MAG: four helix bundle protein [Candidatus Falkowbacteria bacterium RIFOXYB2_FULL_35_7]OGF33808.1 MAG: four helix bundle protein [Candidatus Falkowbacteria bacterium RIFOXYA2_FULL_35_8]OGF45931.1 MAG: four helix bundle protein [Candidatus Falkowbacteria bacterium RIFOXYD2_FULL_35_9]